MVESECGINPVTCPFSLLYFEALNDAFEVQNSFLHHIKACRTMQLRFIKVETLLNNAFNWWKGINTLLWRNVCPFPFYPVINYFTGHQMISRNWKRVMWRLFKGYFSSFYMPYVHRWRCLNRPTCIFKTVILLICQNLSIQRHTTCQPNYSSCIKVYTFELNKK